MGDKAPAFPLPLIGLAGPSAAICFALAVVGFAARRTDGYTHGTKAISELGAVGAPNALLFSLFANVIPGVLLLLLCGWLMRCTPDGGRRLGLWLLVLSALGLVFAGVFPLDLSNLKDPVSIMHSASALTAGLAWVSALFFVGRVLRSLGLHTFARWTPWFALFMVVNIFWQVLWQTTGSLLPGYGQRIAFTGYFLWFGWLGVALWTRASRNRAFLMPRGR